MGSHLPPLLEDPYRLRRVCVLGSSWPPPLSALARGHLPRDSGGSCLSHAQKHLTPTTQMSHPPLRGPPLPSEEGWEPVFDTSPLPWSLYDNLPSRTVAPSITASALSRDTTTPASRERSHGRPDVLCRAVQRRPLTPRTARSELYAGRSPGAFSRASSLEDSFGLSRPRLAS